MAHHQYRPNVHLTRDNAHNLFHRKHKAVSTRLDSLTKHCCSSAEQFTTHMKPVVYKYTS